MPQTQMPTQPAPPVIVIQPLPPPQPRESISTASRTLVADCLCMGCLATGLADRDGKWHCPLDAPQRGRPGQRPQFSLALHPTLSPTRWGVPCRSLGLN